ncbi:MAG: hypothetical protein HY900_25065, partial [Deltaproteobacteria bacterium]|nr:hypothetical protein [Deltaproteobacteria bacterium]
ILLNPGSVAAVVRFPWGQGRFTQLLDAAEARWGGPGSDLPEAVDAPADLRLEPYVFAVYAEGAAP